MSVYRFSVICLVSVLTVTSFHHQSFTLLDCENTTDVSVIKLEILNEWGLLLKYNSYIE